MIRDAVDSHLEEGGTIRAGAPLTPAIAHRQGLPSRLLAAYRRTGAELPFADPGRNRGTALEGYYWRFVDAASGRVVVALCGVCRTPAGAWALVTLAGHPGGLVRHATVATVTSDDGGREVTAGSALYGSPERLSVRLDADAWVDVRLRRRTTGAGRVFGALGPAHAIPGLPQYWHPLVLAAEVEGEAQLGDARFRLERASGYMEKNWGTGFPDHWWWGQAGNFEDADAGVAFAGGPIASGPARFAATAVVVRLGERVLRLTPPRALVRAEVAPGTWRVRARSAHHTVEIEGDAPAAAAHALPVPDVRARTVRMRSRQHLAGRLALRVRRGRTLAFAGESRLAGLEVGMPPDLADPLRRVRQDGIG